VFDACTVPLVAQPFPDGNAALYINCGTVSTSFNVATAGIIGSSSMLPLATPAPANATSMSN
jgi:hypothetical protein